MGHHELRNEDHLEIVTMLEGGIGGVAVTSEDSGPHDNSWWLEESAYTDERKQQIQSGQPTWKAEAGGVDYGYCYGYYVDGVRRGTIARDVISKVYYVLTIDTDGNVIMGDSKDDLREAVEAVVEKTAA